MTEFVIQRLKKIVFFLKCEFHYLEMTEIVIGIRNSKTQRDYYISEIACKCNRLCCEPLVKWLSVKNVGNSDFISSNSCIS